MDVSGELMENNPTKTSALSELAWVGWWVGWVGGVMESIGIDPR